MTDLPDPARTSGFPHRDLLGIEGLSPSEILALLDKSEIYVKHNRQTDKKLETLHGRTIVNLFFETANILL